MAWFDISFADGTHLARLPTPTCGEFTLVTPEGNEIAFDETPKQIKVPILGSGHFGVVVRAVDPIGLRRAIKLIDVTRFAKRGRRPQSATQTSEGIASSLEAEIRTTNARLFKHVVPVVGHGDLKDASFREIPYAVSPFVDGPLLHVHLSARLTTALTDGRPIILNALHDLLLDLIDDLMGALVELEEGHVCHLDLKPTNVVVQLAALDHPNVRDQAFVIDFAGAVSRLSQPAGTRVPLMWTPAYFPDAILRRCGHDARGMVDHSCIAHWGPTVDRHCCAKTLEHILLDRTSDHASGKSETFVKQERAKEEAWRQVLGDDFDVVAGLVGRLKCDHQRPFENAADARRAFQAIGRNYSSAVLASRALTDRTRGLVINVGLRSVRLAPPFNSVISHSAFQRLRKLRQLALISDIFPGATHSRFTHSIATFGLAKDFLLALNRDSEFRQVCSQRDVDEILAAALIHDLGQYPFSHTIEDLRKIGDIFEVPYLQPIRHDQEVIQRYAELSDRGTSIRNILEDNGLRLDSLVYMAGKDPKHRNEPSANVGRDIVSGIMDVDRVSYLLQDSTMTGVPFGGAIDIDALIDSLCVRSSDGTSSLAVRESGISSVEAILAAVYWMYKNVYWHPINRGMMAAVKHAMSDLLERDCTFFESYLRYTYGKSDEDALKFLSRRYDALVRREVKWWNPIRDLARGERSPIIRVWSLGLSIQVPGSLTPDDDLYVDFLARLNPQLVESVIDEIGAALPQRVTPKRGEILLDVPLKKRILPPLSIASTKSHETETEAGRREPLWVRLQSQRGGGHWNLVEQRTTLITALSVAEDASARKIRVFFSRELLSRLKSSGHELWSLVDATIRDVVYPPAGEASPSVKTSSS